MRYALNLPAFGAFADVHVLASLAREAEDAGWDGFFIWDHIQSELGMPVTDSWVALSASLEEPDIFPFLMEERV